MATIGTAIKLNDMITAPLRNITSAMNMMLSTWEDMDNATSGGLNVRGVEEIRNEIDQATRSLQRMENEQEDFNQDVQKGTNAMDGLISKIAGAVSAYVGFNTISSAIDFASDLAEVQNVVDVSFGSSAEAINEWSKTTLNAFGLNELSAKQFAGTMGAMLKSSGLSGDAVSEMSMKIAELSGDMASFYNLSGEDAFNKLRSGISGETEPLKQLGINMSVANLEAYAMSQGINKAFSEMSQAEQVMLRYNYLLQATADSQGDFARTSDSFSNQQKLLAENWKAFTGEIVSGLLPALSQGISMLNSGISWLSENWSVLQPIVLGIVAAIGAYSAALLINNTITGISAGLKAVHAAAEMMATGATFAATVAQHGFNAALLACPITWIILAIIAVIAIIYAVIAAINKVQGTTVSATGVIMGVLASAVAFIWNLFLGLVDFVLGIISALWNKFAVFANFFGNVFTDPIGSIIHLFGDMADYVLGILETIASAIDKVFGSNLASTVSGWRSSLDAKIVAAAELHGNGKYEEKVSKVNLTAEDLGLSRWAYTDAYNSGYEFGAGIEDTVGDIFGGTSLDDLTTGIDEAPVLGEIATNTGDTAKALEVTNENLKYMRDLAEQEVVNRFTTAEISVNMGGVNNTVNSNTDLDGVMDYMVTGIYEAIERVAEGVHS